MIHCMIVIHGKLRFKRTVLRFFTLNVTYTR